MSEDIKDYGFYKTLGIISSWDTYTFGDNANIGENKHPIPRSRIKFTVDDIYMMLRRLKHFIDPKQIDKLERMVTKHIADKNNPHGLTLDQLTTSVMNELYKDWLDYQNRVVYNSQYTEEELHELLSTEQFLKVLFQQITIADVDTALEGKSTYQVTSARDVHAMLEAHDKDSHAHAELMEYMFPGAMHTYPPTFSLMADIGVSGDITVSRSGTLSYMGVDGKMYAAPADTLPIDYSTGGPAFPIFNATTNLCTHGSLLNSSVFSKTNVSVSPTGDIESIVPGSSAYKVSSTETLLTSEHKLSYTIPANTLSGKSTLCISIFAKPGTLSQIALNAHTGTPNVYNAWRYDLSTLETFAVENEMDSGIYAGMYDTPSGYVRCTYICPVIANQAMIVDIHILDILDGDLTFKGYSTNYLYLDGLQIETDIDVPSPYKSTVGSSITENATTISYSVTTGKAWYNPYQGSILAEFSSIRPIESLQVARYIADFTFGTTHTTGWAMYYPAIHGGRCGAYFGNANGSMVYNHLFDTPTSDSPFHKYGMSFVNSRHLQKIDGEEYDNQYVLYSLGSNEKCSIKNSVSLNNDVPTAIDTLYIGCKSNGTLQLNGYLKQFIYYPTFMTPNHFTYFIKG